MTKTCTFTDTAAGAQSFMELEADREVADFTRDSANGRWVPDAFRKMVWGFQVAGEPGSAIDGVTMVIVDLERRDFEMDDELFMALAFDDQDNR
jgi:hypothetical protein